MPLSQEQLRVLGCLLEKERTTPADYPLTGNALMRAANQTTSRDPVVNYTLGQIEHAVTELKTLGLLRFVHSPSNRATKYRQVLDEAWDIDREEAAVLALLFLRGPQTPGEIRSRAERLATFDDVSAVRDTLRALAERPEPMVVELDRVPGHKETRWAHLLGDEVPTAASPSTFDEQVPSTPHVSHAASTSGEAPADAGPAPSFPSAAATTAPDEALAARVESLEGDVAELRRLVDELRSELGLGVSGPE